MTGTHARGPVQAGRPQLARTREASVSWSYRLRLNTLLVVETTVNPESSMYLRHIANLQGRTWKAKEATGKVGTCARKALALQIRTTKSHRSSSEKTSPGYDEYESCWAATPGCVRLK